MHRLSKIRIENYKSIKKLTLPFTSYTPLVGKNNTGKSNILEAIEWFLQPTGLQEEAFRNPENRILVTGTIEGIDQNLFNELDEKHQKQIEKYIVEGRIVFRRIQLKPSGRKGDRKLEVLDPTKDAKDPKAFRKAPTGLPEALTKLFPDCIFIEAMDDATKDISKNQSTTTIGQLISLLSDTIEKNNKQAIENSLGILEDLFGADGEKRAKQLDEFDNQARKVINDFFPGIEIKLHIPPPTLDEILKNGTVQVKEDGELRDFEALGHGAQRSIQMALVRLLREFNSNQESGTRKFLLIEEPELYLHPSAIFILKNALKELSESNFQIVFATHSPIVITREDIPDTILIRKNLSRGTYRLESIRELVKKEIEENDAQADLLFSLTNSSSILFSNFVLLMEGKTEKETIPILYEKISKDLKKKREIAFIPMNGGGGIPKAEKILKAMNFKTLSLVDMDFCFKESVQKGLLEEKDEDLAKFKDKIKDLCFEKNIALGDDGYPINNDAYSAAEAYVELAKESSFQLPLKNLQEKLANKGYWMWRTGDLEKTLGLPSKGQYESLIREINKGEDWKPLIEEAEEIEDFVKWLNEY